MTTTQSSHGDAVAAPDPHASSRRSPASVLTSATVVAAIVVGTALRAWYLTHTPITSDEAVAGLMAHSILQGHFYAFYWGQQYGGGEPYVIAAAFAIFGPSGVLMRVTTTALAAVSAVLTWRVARRLVADSRIAMLAAALAWVAPASWVGTSTYEYGFRGVTLLAGLTCLLFTLRILDEHHHDGRVRMADAAALGLAAGVGWWSSPEIAYFLLPTGLILLGALAHRPRPLGWFRHWVRRLAILIVAFVVGALPWLWANARSGMASLSSKAFDAHPPLDFSQRLHLFFHLSGPIEINMKLATTGLNLVGNPTSPGAQRLLASGVTIAVVIVLAVAALLCLERRGRAVAIVIGVAAFPFLYAASPATWYWEDGHYATYVGPLLAMMLAVATEEALALLGRLRSSDRLKPAHRRSGSRLRGIGPVAMAVVVLVGAASTIAAFHKVNDVDVASFTTGWGNPDRTTDMAVAELEARGITRGYADYWVAYDVDFLSRGHLVISPIHDEDRSAAITRAAMRGTGQAWLFEVPFNGPDGMTESAFLLGLRARHLRFRVIPAGSITAVVPASTLTPTAGVLDAKS